MCVNGIVSRIENKLENSQVAASKSDVPAVEDVAAEEEKSGASEPTKTTSQPQSQTKSQPDSHGDLVRDLKAFVGDALRSLDLGLIEEGQELDDNTLAALGVGALSLLSALFIMLSGSGEKSQKKR